MRAAPPAFHGVFRDDLSARALYAEAAGIQRVWPSAVAVPRDAEAVSTLVRWAAETHTPLVPRGSGTSMAGGAIGAGVIVDLSRFRSRGSVDVIGRRIAIGPGTLRDEVDAEARRFGLRFPVDPSSGAYCTVGGMAATNAAGARTLKYGPTRPWVTSLDCVFADGARSTIRRGAPLPAGISPVSRFLETVAPQIRTQGAAALSHAGVRKDASGYGLADYARSGELVDLLVGSEGTLAMFVGLELALAPIPAATASLLAAFPVLEAAVAGAATAREARASACELLDRTFLELVREAADAGSRASDVPAGTEAVLLIELESDADESASVAAAALARDLAAAGASRVDVALDPAAEHALWKLRHAASPVLARLDPALKSMQFIEDGAVPPAQLAAYVRGVRAALARYRMPGAIFGHAGDAHIHVNPLVDVSDPAWRTKVESLLGDVAALTLQLGGTLTGEHGDGRLRAPLLSESWGGDKGPSLRLFRAVKEAFDPLDIMNPGVKLPAPGAPVLGDVKYDPLIPPLPDQARRALDHVADDRAYAELRLSLIEPLPTGH